MARKFTVGGNFKMNGNKASLKTIAEGINNTSTENVEVFVAPPACYLSFVSDIIDKSKCNVTAQNIHENAKGAFTGEISADMLVDLEVKWAILGHSERRHVFGESDEQIAKKVKYGLEKGLTLVACTGEKLEEREAGKALDVNARQLKSIADAVGSDNLDAWKNIIIAYEPVWAIGTGVTASPDQAQDIIASLRVWLKENVSQAVADQTRILYGGSVNGKNCRELAAKEDIDGFLVGGASLKPEFSEIINARN